MSSRLTKNIQSLLRDLIKDLSGFDEETEEFKICEKFAHSHVGSYHYLFTENRNDIERSIDGLAEKFHFHGFVGQAIDLKKCTSKFLNGANVTEDLNIRIAIIKVLLELSESPTTYFSEHPEEFKNRFKEVEEEIDWPNFLNQTKAPVRQNYDESSDDLSETESQIQEIEDELFELPSIETSSDPSVQLDTYRNIHTESTEHDAPVSSYVESKLNILTEANKARTELVKSIQCDWWNKENICEKPKSNLDEAEVALRWEDFINHISMGLLNQKTNIIHEYKVLREIIWQFFTTHSSFSFTFKDNNLVPKENISVASVRPGPFKNFLNTFVPYFAILKTYRDFHNSLLGVYFTPSIPDTFRSYNCAIQDILRPLFDKIRDIEDEIRKQETTYTLLTLARDVRPYFKKIEYLHRIHEDLMKEFQKVDNSFISTTYLLSRLYYGLLNSTSKNEQNIYLTLYLESLYKYLMIIETWLTQDLLEDICDEFIIVDVSKSAMLEKTNYNVEFRARELQDFSKTDGMLNIISTIVLQLGKNIHLLRQLGKLHLVINEQGEKYETLHQEYTRRVLEEIFKYLNKNVNNQLELYDSENLETATNFLICPETPKSSSGMDDLKNIVNTNDGFLMSVFENYIFKESEPKRNSEETLYERIDSNIDRIVPTWQILETIFKEVLKRRYSVPGLMVKNILISQYELQKHFSLIRRIFLFEEDLIFPFYKKMFAQFDEGQPWGNFFWLTSQLQDLVMDQYPDFYENCRVDVSQNWRLCKLPLDAWDMVSIHYRIDWPVSLIIQSKHLEKYHELFQFLMKIKWAMYTLNKLRLSDIQPRSINYKHIPALLRSRIRRLEIMRFRLLNDVSSVQHYILGHLFSSVHREFNKNIEESYDLETLIEAHDKFVSVLYSFCTKLRDYDKDSYGFAKVLLLVLQLQEMWDSITNISEKHLIHCEKNYWLCNKYLRPIIEVDVLF